MQPAPCYDAPPRLRLSPPNQRALDQLLIRYQGQGFTGGTSGGSYDPVGKSHLEDPEVREFLAYEKYYAKDCREHPPPVFWEEIPKAYKCGSLFEAKDCEVPSILDVSPLTEDHVTGRIKLPETVAVWTGVPDGKALLGHFDHPLTCRACHFDGRCTSQWDDLVFLFEALPIQAVLEHLHFPTTYTGVRKPIPHGPWKPNLMVRKTIEEFKRWEKKGWPSDFL